MTPELRYVVTYKDGTIIRNLNYTDSYQLFLDAFSTENNCTVTRDITEAQKNRT